MKEFLVYKIYMFLFEVAICLIIIVLAIFAFSMLPVILSSTANVIIAMAIFVAAGIYSQLYMNRIKGKIGEYITQKVIESYCNKRGYSYLYDVMIKNDMIETSQIDHLIITRRGIAVIETKFHTGKIYGSEFAKDWTYITRGEDNKKHKHFYHNPVMQNYGHVEALKEIVDRDVEYYNMVLFIDTVNLDKCKIENKFTKVGYTYHLNDILEKFDSLSEKRISSVEACEMYNKIKEANIQDRESRKEHINRIRESHA